MTKNFSPYMLNTHNSKFFITYSYIIKIIYIWVIQLVKLLTIYSKSVNTHSNSITPSTRLFHSYRKLYSKFVVVGTIMLSCNRHCLKHIYLIRHLLFLYSRTSVQEYETQHPSINYCDKKNFIKKTWCCFKITCIPRFPFHSLKLLHI